MSRTKNGKPVDVVLGYPTAPDYELNHSDAMGSVVGRFANRIGGAAFYLYEKEYHVTANEHGNCLHSGLHGFAGTVFDMEPLPDEDNAVRLTAESPAGTDGFPGTVQLEGAVFAGRQRAGHPVLRHPPTHPPSSTSPITAISI